MSLSPRRPARPRPARRRPAPRTDARPPATRGLPRAAGVAPAVALLLAGCAGASGAGDLTPGGAAAAAGPTATAAPADDTTYPVTLDNCGFPVVVDAPPQRVVTIKSSTTEMLLALGLGERIVGAAFLDGPVPDDLAEEAVDLPILSDRAPGPEAVLTLEPDLVYAGWESSFSVESAGERGALSDLGVASYVSPSACKDPAHRPDPLTFEHVFAEIDEAGDVFGVPAAAERLVAEQRAALATVEPDTSGLTALWYSSGSDVPYVGAGIGAPQMIMDAVGLRNIAGDVHDTWTAFGFEQVVEEDPDVIVLVDAAWNTAASKIALLEANPATARLTAVREGRFLTVPFAATEAGVRNVEAARDLADQLAELDVAPDAEPDAAGRPAVTQTADLRAVDRRAQARGGARPLPRTDGPGPGRRPRPLAGGLVLAAAALVLLGSVVAAITVGPAQIGPVEVWRSVAAHAGLGTTPLTELRDAIVWDMRLPRVLTAAAVGAGLALAGAVMQSLTRNPLADPYLLGLSSGASLGAVGVLVLGVGVALPAAAFLGATGALVATLALAGSLGALTPTRTVLAGVAVAQLCAAATSFVIFWASTGDSYREILSWLMGSLGGATWTSVAIAGVALVAVGTALVGAGGTLDAFAFGDTSAAALGVDVRRTRLVLLTAVALLTGGMVAVSGSIGFVGLVLPHATRLVVGARHRLLLPLSALVGATFLIWADTLARSVFAPREIPVGILTALIGAPVFAWILRRRRAAA